MADKTVIGKVTQIVGAVLDVKFKEGNLPEINEAIKITRKKRPDLYRKYKRALEKEKNKK